MKMKKELTPQQLVQADALYEKYQDVAPDVHASEYVNPMVTTSLRLPAETHKAVQAAAQPSGMRPTALIRAWIEEGLAAQGAGAIPVAELEELISRHRAAS